MPARTRCKLCWLSPIFGSCGAEARRFRRGSRARCLFTRGCETAELYSMSGHKVLMLTSTLPRWQGDSTPRFVLDLAVNLSKLGWRIDLVAPGCQGARAVENLEGTTVHRFSYMVPASLQVLCYDGGIMPNIRANPARAALVPPFFAAALIAARRLIRTLRPALVHAHWIVPKIGRASCRERV